MPAKFKERMLAVEDFECSNETRMCNMLDNGANQNSYMKKGSVCENTII
jgi:hypothetical protein